MAIWIDFPDLKPVLLAHFMKKCPYIIPAYWPQFKGQSEKEFYLYVLTSYSFLQRCLEYIVKVNIRLCRSRGYLFNADDTIEDQSTFLKRMTGIFMLYVAIMVSNARHNKSHPYGLENAWKWLAGVINMGMIFSKYESCQESNLHLFWKNTIMLQKL